MDEAVVSWKELSQPLQIHRVLEKTKRSVPYG
jgi:hypothetical protein